MRSCADGPTGAHPPRGTTAGADARRRTGRARPPDVARHLSRFRGLCHRVSGRRDLEPAALARALALLALALRDPRSWRRRPRLVLAGKLPGAFDNPAADGVDLVRRQAPMAARRHDLLGVLAQQALVENGLAGVA